ncbi:DUF3158 family protein [Delftia lacustris]|uniref:DUF3158 family protein n=1 Tax=Delftia lacustris TaxID=558537 RepID=UPI00193B07BD|nr:DUF3158 family protein [Delftia lacustris]QRI93351.1 DUF3158 family protein [Delftia lacustris]
MTGRHTPMSRFAPLEQSDYLRLPHAAYQKGLLRPFKGKGALAIWADDCLTLRDATMALAQRRILPQATRHPFSLLPVELALQHTSAGTSFLRWRKPDRSGMGVPLWQALMSSTSTPVNLLHDLFVIEQQRVVMNMQISLLHTLARQARECAAKLGEAEDAYVRRLRTLRTPADDDPTFEIHSDH